MSISLVIPGYNCERTIGACLAAVVPLLERGELAEIIFVDDGSTDHTAAIVAQYPVRVIRGSNGGAGAARNVGWRAATGDFVWFIDSDCVAQPDALRRLLPHLIAPQIAGVGGSYGNMCPASLTASLIHEEIVSRHARMPAQVNFLGTFNVLYRRERLVEVGGFDECRYNGPGVAGAEDAELAFRLVQRGHRLAFEPKSIVGHFHPEHYGRYLRVQQRHGFYRVRLYCDYPQRMPGDSYSGPIDHVQPPLAMLILATAPLTFWSLGWICLGLVALLMLLQLPMTMRLIRQTGKLRYATYVGFGFLRAFRRGFGMSAGVLDGFFAGVRLRLRPAVSA